MAIGCNGYYACTELNGFISFFGRAMNYFEFACNDKAPVESKYALLFKIQEFFIRKP